MSKSPEEIALERIAKAKAEKATNLDLSKLGLSILPPEIGLVTTLQKLNVSENLLTTLPPEIGSLSAIQNLALYRNQLKLLPPEIGGLKSLQSVFLFSNKLQWLPREIGFWVELQSLYLGGNQLDSLPAEIGLLKSLGILDCWGNPLRAIPSTISGLVGLRYLKVSRAQLTTLSLEICSLTELKSLEFTHNRITELPPEIGALNGLQNLNLSGNHLNLLPPEIGALNGLQSLNLSDNQLNLLPPEIGALNELQTLRLDGNQLTTLPVEISSLKCLKSFDLTNNRLTELPQSLQRLVEEGVLKDFYLHDNPTLGLPDELLGPNRNDVKSDKLPKPPKEILDYYFSTRGEQGQALGEFRLIVVGRPKAGKTSLIKRLRGLPMEHNEAETHGIDILPLDLLCPGRTLHARVWDFGGQHVLHAMHELFLRSRCLYLLVVEQRTDGVELDLTYWLQLIRSYAGDAPVVVALNQSKGIERALAKATLEKEYGPILAWVPTECEADEEVTGASQTIESLRKALTQAADAMPEPKKLFPKKWLQIKRWLEGMEEPYLDYDTYARRCTELREEDPLQQAALAAAMDELGVAINYARDSRLHDTTVLRPNWLANGIYAILRANILARTPIIPDGVLTESKVGEILEIAGTANVLEPKEYPRDKWSFLLRLMNLFQLSFPLDEAGERFLVPTLLPADEPPDSAEPEAPDKVRFRYVFEVIPGPLLGRLIVRLFAFIEGRKVWQRGARLRYVNARARVWTDLKDNRSVFVTVVGSGRDAVELREIIREAMKAMFREYDRLQFIEQWWDVDNFVPRSSLERYGVLPTENYGTNAFRGELGVRDGG